MYTSFFGFTENPFNLTPDPRYLFLSPYHKEALDHLLYGINERKGFIAIAGGIGTGKTTLCRVLLNHLRADTKSALVLNSFISDMELLKSINQEFGIDMDPTAETKKEYIDALNLFLLETFGQGGNAVLLIDEAQNLSHDVLEQIRMLSNLETEKEKLIQIVLVGQPELKEILSAPSIRQLNERITVRYNLKHLAFEDIRGYMEHRLVVAGGRGNLTFSRGALKGIYAYSQGNPRRINSVCDRALLIAYTGEKHDISQGIIREAVREIRGDIRSEQPFNGWSLGRYAIYSILLLLLIMIAGLGGWSFRDSTREAVSVEQKTENHRKEFPPPIDLRPEEKSAPLFLDEQASLSFLFSLYSSRTDKEGRELNSPNLSLVQFDIEPEYYILLKKPFRVCLADHRDEESPTHYLLIQKITDKGAIVIDTKGEEQPVTRGFILEHWGQKVSWVYPTRNKNPVLFKGMRAPDILELQSIFNKLGYLVRPTGIYDGETFLVTMRFQKEFGLLADGIAGPRTRALLYQMVN